MEASLVNAYDEQDLANILDELDTPTACTWTEYDGPLWIDVDLNVKVKVKGPWEQVSAAKIGLGNTKALQEYRLLRFSSPGTGTAQAMTDTIMERVFSNTHAAFERALDRAAASDKDDALPNQRALKAAIARDLQEHEKALLAKGVDIDETGGLLPTRIWHFLRRGGGGFELVEPSAVKEFLYGKRAIRPEAAGLVRIAVMTVTFSRDEDGQRAEIKGYKFRTSARGKIIGAHRADAFEKQRGPEAELFEMRRNKTVRWELADSDIKSLQQAVEKQFGSVEWR
jgi:hypothetical protein